MSKLVLVFPHQLFLSIKDMEGTVVLVEDPLFLGDKAYPIKFHKQKLMLHFATLDAFQNMLEEAGKEVRRLTYNEGIIPDYFKYASSKDTVTYFDLVDYTLQKRLDEQINAFKGQVERLESPNFIATSKTIDAYFKSDKDFYMHKFYIHQRHTHDVLMKNGKPFGGKYSFDTENRKKLPKDIPLPSRKQSHDSPYLKKAKERVENNFANNPGKTQGFDYPLTHEEAEKAFDFFLSKKLNRFGPYQDALSTRGSELFHSKLSAALNIGLLNPMDMIKKAEAMDVDIASKEGFIRQILGWREFMRASYVKLGSRLRTSNYLNHTRAMPDWFKQGISCVNPLDIVIKRIKDTAYSHHIERLMVLGNMCLLLRIDPNEVYRFFMATHIDAYDWVMVPNVYGMSQFASGNLLVTKPYFSGANYIKKMSDFEKGEWTDLWDALFYLFLRDNRELIEKSPRLRMLLTHLDRKTKETMEHYEHITKEFFQD